MVTQGLIIAKPLAVNVELRAIPKCPYHGSRYVKDVSAIHKCMRYRENKPIMSQTCFCYWGYETNTARENMSRTLTRENHLKKSRETRKPYRWSANIAGVAGVGFASSDRINAPPWDTTANYSTLAHLGVGSPTCTNTRKGGLRHRRSAVLDCGGTHTRPRCVGVALEHKCGPEYRQPVLFLVGGLDRGAAHNFVLSYDFARMEKQMGMIWQA